MESFRPKSSYRSQDYDFQRTLCQPPGSAETGPKIHVLVPFLPRSFPANRSSSQVIVQLPSLIAWEPFFSFGGVRFLYENLVVLGSLPLSDDNLSNSQAAPVLPTLSIGGPPKE